MTGRSSKRQHRWGREAGETRREEVERRGGRGRDRGGEGEVIVEAAVVSHRGARVLGSGLAQHLCRHRGPLWGTAAGSGAAQRGAGWRRAGW
eukprot:CAMPEP_0196663898 /NCGR_PEP_ID=MMETSP1086-20130531/54688_1 /TAXON_ID=77921 /ORGANISM="Cyanoptyche  gloeocystis , Strain SAG4.97" /LENGTH=91 /DNA_ID=CAMNT_0041999901 /DNA_START=433 /DNA_END=705 /DNA_ORIENTATION=-